jgi:hypothetical protein
MALAGMIYILTFIKIGNGVQKLLRGIQIEKQTARWSHKPTFLVLNETKVG